MAHFSSLVSLGQLDTILWIKPKVEWAFFDIDDILVIPGELVFDVNTGLHRCFAVLTSSKLVLWIL